MNNTKEVDWDKAPEGATHYNEERSRPWLRDVPASFYYDGEWIEYPSDDSYWKDHFSDAIKRPQAQEWDGNGVPPVGTECEYRLYDGKWFKCKIMYVLTKSEQCFVAWCDHLASDQFLSFGSGRYKLQLRKINKTHEQAKAEERNLAIDEMLSSVDRYSTFKDVMAVLYDAGYRRSAVATTQESEGVDETYPRYPKGFKEV